MAGILTQFLRHISTIPGYRNHSFSNCSWIDGLFRQSGFLNAKEESVGKNLVEQTLASPATRMESLDVATRVAYAFRTSAAMSA